MTPRRLLVSLFALVTFGAMSTSSRAGIPIIYGVGDTIAYVADLPADHPARQEIGAVALGYKYWRFHIYWGDLWTSGGEFGLYNGDAYWSLGTDPKLVAEETGVPIEQIRRPFFYLFPLGWVILAGLVVVCTVYGIIAGRNAPATKAAKLLKQPRYKEALEIAGAGPDGFRNAVAYLEGQGVPADQAAGNMSLLRAYLTPDAPDASAP